MADQGKRCAGCGAPLQSEDRNKPGYLQAELWQREDAVCMRCFKIKNYNEEVQVEVDAEEFRRILDSIRHEKALVLHLIDLTDIHGTLLTGIHRMVGMNPILLVANKLDLLPQSVNPSRLKDRLSREVAKWGIKPVELLLMSALRGLNLSELVGKMERYRQGKSVYVIGVTNAGKSTLINRLLREYGEGEGMEITTSRIPGTTLDRIGIPLDDRSFLYDTPGIVQPHQITHYLSLRDLKRVIPAKRINPKIYQLQPGQTLLIGGLARIDFTTGEPQPFVLYVSNEVPIHRTKTERADALFEREKGKLLSPPEEEGLMRLPPFTRHTFRLLEGRKEDLAIAGLGWISFTGKKGSVEVRVPKGVLVSLHIGMI